jgi:hypothetical protein
MSMIAAAVKHMLAAGMKPDEIVSAVADMEAAAPKDASAERRRAKDRERKRLRNSAETAENAETLSPKKEIPPTPPKEKTTPIPISVCGDARATDFDQFWSIYPNKVGKRDAAKAFVGARQRADFETILAGVRRYSAKTDDRPWCNPSTFLNQDRWADDPAAPVAAQPRSQAPPTHAERVNAVLDRIISNGKSNEPPTFDASFERRDSRGADVPLRLVAASKRD